MFRFNTFLMLVLGCLVSVGVGCGDDTTPTNTGSSMTADASLGADAGVGGDASDVDPTADVPCDSTYPAYHDGMTQKAGDLTVKLLSVNPNPPRQQTPNNWALQVVNADGTPATGFTVSLPDSYMPVHNHHGRQPPKVAMDADSGTFQLNTIDFFMRGPWRVTFSVTPTGGKEIVTTFQVCVE